MISAARAVVLGEPGVELEAIISEQIARWTRGDREPVEAILGRHPEFLTQQSAVLELIYQEIVLREISGDTPVPEDYLGRFADRDLSLGIERLFEVHRGFSGHDTAVFPRDDPAWTGRPALGVSIPGYDVGRKLGEGGMGVVYLARHRALNRPVALKMLHLHVEADAEEHARLVLEAEAIAKFQHPNLVQIHEVGEHEGRPYLALEYLDGGTLAKQLAGQLPGPREAAGLVETLARAIDHAHERGVVHRDLKPANVLLTAGAIPKITDFGLAMLADSRSDRTGPGAILGTLAYMAPEQTASRRDGVGPPADIYALGVILYEALTGHPPFRGATILETLEMVRKAEPTPPRRIRPEISRDLETITLKCLEKSPDRRYASARALADDLRRHLDREPILARPISGPERLAKWAARRPWQAISAALGIVVLTVVVGGTLIHNARLRAEVRRGDQQYRSARAAIQRLLDRFDEASFTGRPLLENFHRRQLEDALVFYEGAVRDSEPSDFEGRLDKAGTLRELARFQITLGKLDDAFPTLRQALDLLNKLEAERPDDPDVAMEHVNVLNKLAVANQDAKRIGEAVAVSLKAIARADRASRLQPDSLALEEALAWSHNNLGTTLHGAGRFVEAVPHLSKSAEVRRRLRKIHPDHPDLKLRLAENLMALGANHMKLKRHDAAEAMFSEAAELLDPLVKAQPDQRLWAVALCKLNISRGKNKLDGDEFNEAIEQFRAGRERIEVVFREFPDWPEARLRRWQLNYDLATALAKAGRHREALEPLNRAIALLEGKQRVSCQMDRADCFARAGDPAPAMAEAEAVAKEVQYIKGPDWYNLACVASVSAGLFKKSGLDSLAGQAADRAMQWLQQACDPEGIGYNDVLVTLVKGDKDVEFLDDRPDFRLLRSDAVFPPDPFRPAP